MKVPFGTQLSGDVRTAAGMVSTKFFHVAHLPLIPLGSYLVDEDHNDHFVGRRAGWHLGSIALAYFRTWGFIAALGLAAWTVYMFGRSSVPWSTLVLVPALSMLLVATTLGSYHLLAGDHGKRLRDWATGAGITVAVMLAASSYLWIDRAQYDAAAARSVAEARAEAAKPLPPRTQLTQLERMRRDSVDITARRVAAAAESIESFKLKRCTDPRLANLDDSDTELVVGEFLFLGGTQRTERAKAHGWMMSPDLVTAFATDLPTETLLAKLDQRWLWAVVYTEEVTGKRGRRSLHTVLAIVEKGGDVLCKTEFDVDSTEGQGATTPPASVQTAFKDKARAELAKMSKRLRIYPEQIAKH
jgi:hypothetical protein